MPLLEIFVFSKIKCYWITKFTKFYMVKMDSADVNFLSLSYIFFILKLISPSVEKNDNKLGYLKHWKFSNLKGKPFDIKCCLEETPD